DAIKAAAAREAEKKEDIELSKEFAKDDRDLLRGLSQASRDSLHGYDPFFQAEVNQARYELDYRYRAYGCGISTAGNRYSPYSPYSPYSSYMPSNAPLLGAGIQQPSYLPSGVGS